MFKALAQLASASLLAQVISLGIMPIITRLHTPESLGEYQFFTTLALVLSPFISGSLAVAIQSSNSQYRALINLKLALQYSFIATALFILISPIIFYLLSESTLSWFSPYLLLLILFLYLSANFQFSMALLTNNKNYGYQSTFTITKSGISNSLKLVFSFYSKSGISLVWALVITEALQLTRLIKSDFKKILDFLLKFKWSHFKKSISQLIIYPTYVTITSVIGILRNWFPILVTGYFYGTHYAGLLGLAFMVVNTPVYPFISALQNVCFGELARGRKLDNLISVYSKSMGFGLIPSILGLFILGVYGEVLFEVVFGDEWSVAGLYAFICFIPISLSLVLSPVYNTLNHFFSFQKVFFWINLLSLVVGVLATSYIGYKSLEFEWFIIAFSLTMTISHVILFLASLMLVRKRVL